MSNAADVLFLEVLCIPEGADLSAYASMPYESDVITVYYDRKSSATLNRVVTDSHLYFKDNCFYLERSWPSGKETVHACPQKAREEIHRERKRQGEKFR